MVVVAVGGSRGADPLRGIEPRDFLMSFSVISLVL